MWLDENIDRYLSDDWRKCRMVRTSETWTREKAEAIRKANLGSRIGRPWEKEEENFLLYAWPRMPLVSICQVVERTPVGAMARLAMHGRLCKDRFHNYQLIQDKAKEPVDCGATRFEISRPHYLRYYEIFHDDGTQPNTNAAESAAPTPKENPMKIETRTFINGVDASTLSDDAIFNEIAEIEAKIAHLRNLKTQSRKRDQTIAKMEKYAVDLAAYLDGR